MMALRHIIISAVGSVVFYAGTAAAAPRSQLQQDVEGYAVATCLTGWMTPLSKIREMAGRALSSSVALAMWKTGSHWSKLSKPRPARRRWL